MKDWDTYLSGYEDVEKRELMMLKAALSRDPDIFSKNMTEAEREEYERTIKWIEEVKKENPNATIDVPYGYD